MRNREKNLQKKTVRNSFLAMSFSNIFLLTFSIWSDISMVVGSVSQSSISSSSNRSPQNHRESKRRRKVGDVVIKDLNWKQLKQKVLLVEGEVRRTLFCSWAPIQLFNDDIYVGLLLLRSPLSNLQKIFKYPNYDQQEGQTNCKTQYKRML